MRPLPCLRPACSSPYFINGERLVVGIAMDQLRPAALGSGLGATGVTIGKRQAEELARAAPPVEARPL